MQYHSILKLKEIGIVVAIFSLPIMACGVTINQVLTDPHHYTNRDQIKLKGDVVKSYSVLGHGAYQIDDGTGMLWVVTTKGVPEEGSRVTVQGKVREGVDLGTLSPLIKEVPKVVLVESEHRAKPGIKSIK